MEDPGVDSVEKPKTTLLTMVGKSWNPYKSVELDITEGALVCVEGPHEGLEVPLDSELLHAGRMDWNHIVLPLDSRVSGLHCELRISSEGIIVRDMGSSNGTFIDGTRIFEAPLLPDSRLQMGHCTFVYQPKASSRKLQIEFHDHSGQLVGRSRLMRKIFSMINRVAPSTASVLLKGETGTGKTSIARAIHESSQRVGMPFVVVNCGALSPSLVESELFGYEKGAFTGAQSSHKGVLEQADGGTLFLDEIGELPLDLQPKLLDVFERQAFRRLGGEKEIQVDIRLVTATHRNLLEAVKAKTFREDLYYRLAVCELKVPALRERVEDIPLLIEYTLAQLYPKESFSFTERALERLQSLLWPGNVRQLRNVVETTLLFSDRPVVDADDLVLPEHLEQYVPEVEAPSHSVGHGEPSAASPPVASTGTLKERVAQEEARILRAVLEEHRWDIDAVYQSLDISRSSLYHKMKKYDIKQS